MNNRRPIAFADLRIVDQWLVALIWAAIAFTVGITAVYNPEDLATTASRALALIALIGAMLSAMVPVPLWIPVALLAAAMLV